MTQTLSEPEVTEVIEPTRPPCARPFQHNASTGETRWACEKAAHPADWMVVLSCGCVVYACDKLLEAVCSMPQVCGDHPSLGDLEITETLPL